MIERKQKVAVMGGALGTLGIPELKEARNGINTLLENPSGDLSEIQLDALDQLGKYLTTVIEDHLTVGRRF